MASNTNINLDPAAAALNRDSPETQVARRPIEGALAGNKLTVSSSPESLLADAAEELTFSVDNTEELDLKERKEKKTIDPSLVQRVKLYRDIMKKRDLTERFDALRSALKNCTRFQDVLDQAYNFFSDPADVYAALSELADSLPDNALIKEALEALDQESGSEIRASIAGALAGLEFSDLGEPLQLKNDYVRVAIDFSDVLDMFNHIINRFGPECLDRGVDFLNRALAADLAADTPSCDKTSLESVADQLGKVRSLNSIRALGQNLADRWREVHGQSHSELVDMDFLKFILEGRRESLPTTSLAAPLIRKANPEDIEKEVLFRQDLLQSVKNLTVQTFGDLDQRARFINAIQEGLDEAVSREDEWLAAMEDDS
ncbi:MAG: type III secretion system gatekeeper subunit SctW [Deltaproteobacteria bacterium]|jgi:type III secretion protein W|nr:type III secretion system gatekeeper subunit SctW [Deltaproteobacteria bacterium]